MAKKKASLLGELGINGQKEWKLSGRIARRRQPKSKSFYKKSHLLYANNLGETAMFQKRDSATAWML